MSYSCWGGASGATNFDAEPRFRDHDGGDFRLRADSPCLNKGLNQPWMAEATDLVGARRIFGQRVDPGCYECQATAASIIMVH